MARDFSVEALLAASQRAAPCSRPVVSIHPHCAQQWQRFAAVGTVEMIVTKSGRLVQFRRLIDLLIHRMIGL